MLKSKPLLMASESNYEDILNYLKSYPYDCDSIHDISSITESDELKHIICLGRQFIYFACLNDPEMDFAFITPSVYDVIGYKPEELSTKKIYELIHPADRKLIIKATLISVSYQKKLRMDPMKYILHMDFRLRKKNSDYIRVSRQTANYKNNRDNLMRSLGLIVQIFLITSFVIRTPYISN